VASIGAPRTRLSSVADGKRRPTTPAVSSKSTVIGNSTGYDASSGGTLSSFGDNYFASSGSSYGTLGGGANQSARRR
jgi:hypothetical protein